MKPEHTELIKRLEEAGFNIDAVVKMVYAKAGQSRSPAKQAASRRNAIKGGIPKAKSAVIPTIRQTDIWKADKKLPEPIYLMPQSQEEMRVLVLKQGEFIVDILHILVWAIAIAVAGPIVLTAAIFVGAILLGVIIVVCIWILEGMMAILNIVGKLVDKKK